MLANLSQWMSESRRIELRRDRLLRKIDHDVETAIAHTAQTPMGQIALADIFHNTILWSQKYPRSRRRSTVDELHGLVEGELRNRLSQGQLQELRQLAAGQRLNRKQVDLWLLYAPLPARVFIQPHTKSPQHMRTANEIWAQANVGVARLANLRRPPAAGGQPVDASTAERLDGFPLMASGALGFDGEMKLAEKAARGLRGFIRVCYAPSLFGGGGGGSPAGQTLRRSANLVDSIIKIGANLARDDTLAHELGHVLLNEGGHHSNPVNLMAAGMLRTGRQLTPGQIILARNCTYCR